MLVRFAAFAVLGILVCGLMASTASRGLTQSVDVVVLVDPPFVARYGDTVNVTALIFDRGVASDPSAISASIDKLPGIDPLTLHRDSLGVYRGAFVFRSHPSVVKVNATVAGVQDSGSAVVLEKSLSVAVLPSKMIATAGERISVGVEVRDNHNALTDVRWLNLTAQIGYAPFEAWSASENISSTRTAVGQYSAYYTVPPNISRDAIVAFQASAVNPGGGFGVGSPVYVEFPDPFLIWYRTVAIGASNVTVEFDVASNGGQPLPNVTVSVRTAFPSGPILVRQGTTDAAGAVRFDVPSSVRPTELYGNATLGPDREVFFATFVPPASPPPPPPPGPRLVRENAADTFATGDAAVLRFRLASGDVPVQGQNLFVYAQTWSQLVLAGRVTTDNNGRFEVRFTVPPDSVRIGISGNISGTWTVFHDSFSPMSRFEPTVSSADGWQFMISAVFPPDEVAWTADVTVAAVPGSSAPWIAAGPFGPHRIVAGSGSSPFALGVTLPRFLPVGQAVSVSIAAYSPGGGYATFSTTIIAGTPVSPGMSGPRPIDWGVLLVVIGFGAVVAIAASGWRRKPRTPRSS